jgi:hypothetical protein
VDLELDIYAFLPPPYHHPDDAEVSAALDGLALDTTTR